MPNVPYHGIVGDNIGIGYVALTTFTREAGTNVANAVRELKEQNPPSKASFRPARQRRRPAQRAVNVCNVLSPEANWCYHQRQGQRLGPRVQHHEPTGRPRNPPDRADQ